MRFGKRISAGLMTLALGFAVSTANAQPILQSLAITTATGSKIGIDKTVVVTASVFQSSADANLQVIAWLVSDGDGAATAYDVLFDGSVNTTVDPLFLDGLQSFSALDQGAVVSTAQDVLDCLQGDACQGAWKGAPLKDVNPANAEGPSVVVGRDVKSTAVGTAPTGLYTPLAGSGNFGDADPATTSVTNPSADVYTFTIALQIPASTGEFSDVSVAAIAYDGASYSTDILVTDVAEVVDVDGNRPSQDGITIDVNEGTDSQGAAYIKFADGTSNKDAAGSATHRVAGFVNGAGTRDVGKTGDQIRVDIDLNKDGVAGAGPQENAIKAPNSTLELILDIFGAEVTVNKSQAGAVLSHASLVSADVYDNLATTEAATTNFILYVEDEAGNRSSLNSAGSDGDGLGGDDATATGVTVAVSFVLDSTAPDISGNVQDNADPPVDVDPARAILLPADGDRISDGTIGDTDYSGVLDAADTRTVDDDGSALDSLKTDPLLSWELDEALRELKIEFVGSSNVVTISNAATAKFTHDALLADAVRYLDFTALTTGTANARTNKQSVAPTTNAGLAARIATSLVDGNSYAGVGDDLADGTYDIVVTPTDLAGNVGDAVTRSDVVIDMTEIVFKERFPTTASFGADATRDTINETTANTTFALSEAADSVKIIFDDIGVSDKDTCFVLSTTQLALTDEQTILIGPDLIDDTEYQITVVGRDLAGNFVLTAPDTLFFNVDFVAPTIAQFAVELVDDASPANVVLAGASNPFLAGKELLLRIKATDANGQTAVTFDEDVVVTITGGSPCADCDLTGDGVANTSDTTWSLSGSEFLVGSQTLTLTNEVAPETLTVSATDAAITFAGALDSIIAYDPEVYSKIIVDSPIAVDQGEKFRVNVTLADEFGNTRVNDNRFVEVTSNVPDAQLPVGAIAIKNGTGWFDAVFASGSTHTITVRDIVATSSPDVTISGTLADLDVDGTLALTGIDIDGTVTDTDDDNSTAGGAFNGDGTGTGAGTFAGDGNGTGTFTGTGTTTAYDSDNNGNNFVSGSIDVGVNAGPVAWNLDAPDAVDADDYMGASGDGDQGGFVILTFDASDDHATLDEYLIERQIETNYTTGATASALAWVSWGSVAPTPGAETMYVIVATLDSDEAAFAVSAVRGGVVAKQAFSVSDKVSTPYELMARTMQNSRELAQISVDAPVIATLAPEALAFAETGVVPRMKTGGEDRSRQAISNPARGIDNIPPAPVVFLKALDTQSDLGGSITLTWSKSVDDQLLTQSVPNAVGGAQTYTVQGVKAYNIYRKAGDGEFALIAQAGSGETTFLDQTVFNGMPYTYQVRPSDTDNIAETELVSSALAVRNNVRDAQGVLVRGLFGVDNRVDFDDFFVLADRFGQSASDASFDPAFDLSPNNKVDLDDFFVFVDNFGRSITGTGKVVPMLAGLNSDARLYIDAGSELPRIGEEMTLTLNLEDYVELRGYGLTVNFDAELLEFVGTSVDNGLLGEGTLAQPQRFAETDGQVSIGAFGDVASKGDLGVNLVFRSRGEIESSFIEITDAEVRDGGYGINNLPTPVSVRIETRPEVYALADNYPNPFNPETTLKYQLPESADVSLEIYNMLGQVVRTLVNENQSAGRYTLQWDGKNDSRHSLSSGIYFYRIQAGGEFQSVKKMLLVK